MLIKRSYLASPWLVVSLLLLAGCNQNPTDTKNAAGKPAKPAETAKAKPAVTPDQPDTPAHPAVSSKVDGQNDTSSNAAPVDEPSPDKVAPETTVPTATPDSANPPTPAENPTERVAIPTPPPGVLPEVALSAAHRATCKVAIGDLLPALSLADLKGGSTSLDKTLGSRVTVVAFLQGNDAETAEVLSDLAPLVINPYGSRGVGAVAILSGETPDAIKAIAAQNENAFATLVDADGAALAQITDDAQGLMPRIYLVDSAGKVLWFDIEYSRTTRRDLDRALRYLTR